jgi:hypothetical protein
MKSRLITNNPPPSPAPTFPILKKHVNGKFIVLFFNENSGPVIWAGYLGRLSGLTQKRT